MSTPKKALYKNAQRIAKNCQYRAYKKVGDKFYNFIGYFKPFVRNFIPSFAPVPIFGGDGEPKPFLEKDRKKRNIRNRIAKLSRRKNRRK